MSIADPPNNSERAAHELLLPARTRAPHKGNGGARHRIISPRTTPHRHTALTHTLERLLLLSPCDIGRTTHIGAAHTAPPHTKRTHTKKHTDREDSTPHTHHTPHTRTRKRGRGRVILHPHTPRRCSTKAISSLLPPAYHITIIIISPHTRRNRRTILPSLLLLKLSRLIVSHHVQTHRLFLFLLSSTHVS